MKTNSFLLSVLFFLSLFPTLQSAFADEINVVDVKRNITLSDEDLVYKDFYLNAGEGSGLKKNLVVNVKRKIQVKDASSKSMGDFETLVGQLKIIQVSDKVTVGREFKLFPRDEEAMIDQSGIMTGDRIDLASAFIDTSKPKRAAASEESAKLEATAITSATAVIAPQPSAAKPLPTPTDANVQSSISPSTSISTLPSTLKSPSVSASDRSPTNAK